MKLAVMKNDRLAESIIIQVNDESAAVVAVVTNIQWQVYKQYRQGWSYKQLMLP